MANSEPTYTAHPDTEPSNANIVTRPERNLCAAILSRAICDAIGGAHCEDHHRRSGRRWLFSKLTPRRPFSFAWVAMHLDMDPKSLQSAILQAERGGTAENIIAVLRA